MGPIHPLRHLPRWKRAEAIEAAANAAVLKFLSVLEGVGMGGDEIWSL